MVVVISVVVACNIATLLIVWRLHLRTYRAVLAVPSIISLLDLEEKVVLYGEDVVLGHKAAAPTGENKP